MDVATLDRVKVLSPDAAAVVKWCLRLEGALHHIAEHSDDLTLVQIRHLAYKAIDEEEP